MANIILPKIRYMTIYGIPNCDTIKKTLDWVKANEIAYDFHDYKKEGITKTKLQSWAKQIGTEPILNKKSTTWKGLTLEQQASTAAIAGAIAIMAANPSIIKRPVIEHDGKVIMVGFNADRYEQELKNL